MVACVPFTTGWERSDLTAKADRIGAGRIVT